MDPISLYSGLLDLSNSLATIVNVAHDSKAGQKTLDSTLKELPILFALLKEIMAGVLKAQRAIPQSATLAFQQCQVDLDDVITCLSQRGLMGKGHGGFSHLQAQLSDHSLGSDSSDKSKGTVKPKNPPKERRSLRERLHLMNVQSLAAAVKSFKDSVLLLRYIAMDFQTQTLLLTQSDQQQDILNEVRAIRPKFQSPASLSRDGSTAEENTTIDEHKYEPKYVPELNDSPTKTHHQSSLFSDSVSYHTPKRRPSEYGRLEVKNFSTKFNVTVGIPRPITKHNEPPQPDYILARAVLDTGSANSVISHKMITRHNIGHLTQKLGRKTEWTLADGNGKMTSEAKVKLTWYNTHDAMRSYTTEFYVVGVDIYDILLGGDFYREYGPLKGDGSKEQFMMGHFDIPWRSKEQRKREKDAEQAAQKDAKAKLQQGRENAKKGSQNSSTNLSPVTEDTEASVLAISQDPASKSTAAVNGTNANAPQQANGNALSPKSNGQNVAANPLIASPQLTAATSTPTINALTFGDNITKPIGTRPGRHDAETPPKTPEQGPQTVDLAMPNGKVLLGRSVEDVSGVSEENGKLKEVASEGVPVVSGSRAVEI